MVNGDYVTNDRPELSLGVSAKRAAEVGQVLRRAAGDLEARLAAWDEVSTTDETDDLFVGAFDHQRRISRFALLQPRPVRRRVEGEGIARLGQFEHDRFGAQV